MKTKSRFFYFVRVMVLWVLASNGVWLTLFNGTQVIWDDMYVNGQFDIFTSTSNSYDLLSALGVGFLLALLFNSTIERIID